MAEGLGKYAYIFSIEERKQLTAQMLRELRKMKGYSQKEVAVAIRVKPATYNTYESGRTEPPLEVLVRVSYLYNVSIDTIMQKDRLYRTVEDAAAILEGYRKQLAGIDAQIEAEGENNQMLMEVRKLLLTAIEQAKAISELESVKEDINKSLKN